MIKIDPNMHIAYSGDINFLRNVFVASHGKPPPKISNVSEILDSNNQDGQRRTVSVLWVLTEPRVDKELIDLFPCLQTVITSTTGTTHIDTHLLDERKIQLISLRNFPSRMSEVSSSAEHAWYLILATWRRISQFSNDKQFWDIPKIRYKYPFKQLQSRHIGIIGFGRIGKKVAGYAESFGMTLSFFDPFNDYQGRFEKYRCNSLSSLLESSDVVLLSASKLSEGLILDKIMLGNLKGDAIFVNISRGSLVDEEALICLLREGKIAGIGTDVFSFEELTDKYLPTEFWYRVLADGFNVILTPHIGGAAQDAVTLVHTFIVEECFTINQSGWSIK